MLYLNEFCMCGKSFLPLNIYSKGSWGEITFSFMSFHLTGNFRGRNYAHKPTNSGYFTFIFCVKDFIQLLYKFCFLHTEVCPHCGLLGCKP